MKPKLNRFFSFVLLLFVLLASCKKIDLEKPGGGNKPQPTTVNYKLVFTLEALPGETAPVSNLFALVTIENDQNEAVVTNQKLALHFDGQYSSDTLTLSAGNLRVTRFLIVDANNFTRFATPLATSEMGGQVQKPLAIQFKMPQPTLSKIAMDVLRLERGAQPEKYGYPAGAFQFPGMEVPDEEENTDPNPFIKIKVRPLIKIGDVVYDSVPVAFTLTSWNAAGQPTVVRFDLAPGTAEISLPKAAVRYDLQVAKWGTVDELSLQKSDVQEGAVYTLGGSKAAKKLTSEVFSKMVKNVWVAESKTEYHYDASGKLIKITQLRKRADNTIYTYMTDNFRYNSIGLVEQIVKRDETNKVINETAFTYQQDGKLTNIVEKEGTHQTTASVTYTSRPGNTGITGFYDVDVRYQYSHKPITGYYNMQFQGGLKVEGDLNFSDGGREKIFYQYDFNINPYVHLNWPDLYFTHSSKHTLGSQRNGYDGNYAKGEYPAATDYTFDADGYPKEAVTHYLHPFLGIYLHKTKTVYYY